MVTSLDTQSSVTAALMNSCKLPVAALKTELSDNTKLIAFVLRWSELKPLTVRQFVQASTRRRTEPAAAFFRWRQYALLMLQRHRRQRDRTRKIRIRAHTGYCV